MVVRRRKKKNKLRGHRTHGKGNTKNKRGAGCKGGRGRAGSKKHKKMLFIDEEKKKRLKPKKKIKVVTLSDIEKMIERGSEGIKREGNTYIIDCKSLKIGKILGSGALTKKVKIINVKKITKKAIEKIKKVSGTVEVAE